MLEDRIITEVSYKTTNARGEVTIDVPSIKILDQSPRSASALLIGIIEGALAQARKQVSEDK